MKLRYKHRVWFAVRVLLLLPIALLGFALAFIFYGFMMGWSIVLTLSNNWADNMEREVRWNYHEKNPKSPR